MIGVAVAACCGAYLLGSVPFGYLLVRTVGGIDIRTRGSGNIGATNVHRTLGTTAGLITLMLDGAKGCAAVWVAAGLHLGTYWVAAAAVLVVIGHSFPVFLRFRGGKGVATGAGAFAILTPWAALGAVAVFLVTIISSRFVSLSSIAAAVALPLFAGLWYGPAELVAALVAGLLVVFRHRENIRNLLGGRERRLGGAVEHEAPGANRGD